MAVTTINELLMQPSPVGEVFMAAGVLSGMVNYQQATVYLVDARLLGLLSSLKFVEPEDVSVSGTYFVRFFRVGTGVTASRVRVKWYVLATGAEVANATDLSAERIRVMALGN